MTRCALVIGHKKNSPGAGNQNAGISEFTFNDQLAHAIEKEVDKISQSSIEVQRIYRRTYSTLPSDINEYQPDFIISLHCNAYNRTASGTEVLYYHRSSKGKELANILQQQLLSALQLKDRGIKSRTTEDRGGYLLKNTNAPCLISEPFFIDNDQDLEIVNRNYEKLIAAYAKAISNMAK